MSRTRIILLILCALCTIPLLATGPVSSGVGEHGWSVYRNQFGMLSLVHLPPRAGQGKAGADAEHGSVNAIRQLKSSPEALASIDNRVYMVFAPSTVNNGLIRRVSSGKTAFNPTTGTWVFESASFFDAHSSLPGAGDLRGFAAPGGELHALIKVASTWSLYRLTRTGWQLITLPDAVFDDIRLLEWNDQPLLITLIGDTTAAITRTKDNAWEPIEIRSIDTIWDAAFVLGHDTEIVTGLINDHEQLDVHVLSASSDLIVHTLDDPPMDASAMLLEDSNTLVLLARLPADRDQPSSVRVVEINLTSGRALYNGQPIPRGLLDSNILRFLLMLFFMTGSMAILLSVHPSRSLVFVLPDLYAIAPPPRRMAGMLIDLGILSSIIAPIMDVGIFELLSGNVFARPDSGWISLPILLLTGLVVSTIFESTLGATPGKLAMRTRVVSTNSGPASVLPIHRALLRNTIKWLLPPIAVLGIVEPNHRTRADLLARAVVAVRLEQPE